MDQANLKLSLPLVCAFSAGFFGLEEQGGPGAGRLGEAAWVGLWLRFFDLISKGLPEYNQGNTPNPRQGGYLPSHRSGRAEGERRRGNGQRSRQGIRPNKREPTRVRRPEGQEESTWPMRTGY